MYEKNEAKSEYGIGVWLRQKGQEGQFNKKSRLPRYVIA